MELVCWRAKESQDSVVEFQRKEWGGGEVWFDGELIRKDGKFLPKDLRGLNPENLK